MKLRKRHKRAIIYIKVEKPDDSILNNIKVEDPEDIKIHQIQPASTNKTKLPNYSNNNSSTSNKRMNGMVKQEILVSNFETKLNEMSGMSALATPKI